MPKISKMQIDLIVNSFVNDFARVATYQITNSVGGVQDAFGWTSRKAHTNCLTSRIRTKRPRPKRRRSTPGTRADGVPGEEAERNAGAGAKAACWITR